MSIVGVTVREKKRGGKEYAVVGEFEAGWVIAPVEFDGSPNEHVTAADLAARFGTKTLAEVPAPIDEVAGWRVLGEKFGEAVDAQRRGEVAPPAKAPEQQLREVGP